jgi:maltose/maltodextrin transport system permease protein
MRRGSGPLLARLAAAAAALAGLAAVLQVHAAGQGLLASVLLAVLAAGLVVSLSPRLQPWRYLLPGVVAALVFVVFPMLYTLGLSVTNTSSVNLLERDEARAQLLAQARLDDDSRVPLVLWRQGAGERAPIVVQAGGAWSAPVAPDALGATALTLGATAPAGLGAAPLTLRERVERLPQLRSLVLQRADGTALRLVSLHEVGRFEPSYRALPDGALQDTRTGAVYRPDDATGFFATADGERLMPGYRVTVGLQHYRSLATEPRFREPFVAVLGWTIAFAALSVLISAALGLGLAALLDWEVLEGRALYRTVLFLPYAVPGFISILVFKGLFNPNGGEINALLDLLLGWRPAWFSDTGLARTMLLIVNVWLGFPYMMLLCSGLLKSIPSDLYEASALAGASPWDNLRRITAPLVFRPLLPLLIAAFAFNFNNFVLVSLLTGGRPDQLDSALPVGTTDILVSYTWRIAFQDAGQQLGLAAAVSAVIFAIVAVVTLVQLRLTRLDEPQPAR